MPMKNDGPQISHPMMQSQDKRIAQMQKLVSSPDPLLAAQQVQQEEEIIVTDQGITDLKQLVFLGRVEDVKTIGGFEFKVRTLTSAEYDSVWLGLSILDGSDKILLIKRPILSRAIISVNGASLESLYEGKDQKYSPQMKALEVLSGWQETLVSQVFEFYNELSIRSNKVFSTISEDLKK